MQLAQFNYWVEGLGCFKHLNAQVLNTDGLFATQPDSGQPGRNTCGPVAQNGVLSIDAGASYYQSCTAASGLLRVAIIVLSMAC